MEFDDDRPFRTILKYQLSDMPGEALQHRDFVLDALEASTKGNPGALWALFHPDIVFHVSPDLPYGGAHHGIEAVTKALQTARGYYERMRIEIEQVLFGDDAFIVYMAYNFRAAKNGRTGSFPLAELYRFKDGKIIEWRGIHFDPKGVADLITAD